jgi:hypothetical protein
MRHRLTNRKNMHKWIENKGYEELINLEHSEVEL